VNARLFEILNGIVSKKGALASTRTYSCRWHFLKSGQLLPWSTSARNGWVGPIFRMELDLPNGNLELASLRTIYFQLDQVELVNLKVYILKIALAQRSTSLKFCMLLPSLVK